MSVFGFIENFFFISLALVFVLVLLLVYHFKTRITVAEKKSESMYGLLTAVVKEIKILRGMFGLGGTPSTTNTPSDNFEIKSKTTPEIDVSVSSPALTHPTAQNNQVSKQESVVSADSAKKDAADIKETEVIRLDFSAADNFPHKIDAYSASGRIVVSDDDDDDESSISEEDDSDSESGFESDSGSESEHEAQAQVQVFEIDVPASHLEPEITLTEVNVETVCLEEPDLGISEIPEQNKPEEPELPKNNDVVEIKNLVENIVETVESVDLQQQPPQTPTVVTTIPSIEQLRKMNINQLKTIALQLGITVDISKLKKPELISLIRERDE